MTVSLTLCCTVTASKSRLRHYIMLQVIYLFIYLFVVKIMGQMNGFEVSGTPPHTHTHLVFFKIQVGPYSTLQEPYSGVAVPA